MIVNARMLGKTLFSFAYLFQLYEYGIVL